MKDNTRFFAVSLSLLGSAALAACATVEEAAVQAVSTTHHATLTGAQVPGGGDADGYATAELSVSDELDQICYDVNEVRNLGPITSVTINRAVAGQTGPAILRVDRANEGDWKNCVERAEWLEQSFEYAPGAYYIQIATTEHPNGAIRGQFRD